MLLMERCSSTVEIVVLQELVEVLHLDYYG